MPMLAASCFFLLYDCLQPYYSIDQTTVTELEKSTNQNRPGIRCSIDLTIAILWGLIQGNRNMEVQPNSC